MDDRTTFDRRALIRGAALAAAALPIVGAQAQPPVPPPAQPRQQYRVRNGRGPLKVLFITGDHPFDYNQLFAMFDLFGEDITWNHVTQPAAEQFFDPKMAAPYDVFVLYDRAGRTPRTAAEGNVHGPGDRVASGRDVNFRRPSPALKRGMKAMLMQGKGMVLFHHSIASWVHTWPEYVEMVGGACDWDYPQVVRGTQYAFSGFRGGVQQRISVVDKAHPVVAGLGDGFDLLDETYLCPIFEESVHPLLRTDFVPIEDNFPAQKQVAGWQHPPGSNLTGWYKAVENSPLVYIQHGHDQNAWGNPNFQRLMLNAIKWAGSKQAHAWSRANYKKIFA